MRLLFDGQPLLSKKRAEFSCYDYAQQKWVSCRIKPADGTQRYMMARPYAGRYRMHIVIDEDEGNPDSYAGDYVAIHYYEINPNVQDLIVDVPLLIHLTAPADNNRSIEGAFGACERPPDYTIPFLSWPRTFPIEFRWDPIVEGATYRVWITRVRCDPYERIEQIVTEETLAVSLTLELPRSESGRTHIDR